MWKNIEQLEELTFKFLFQNGVRILKIKKKKNLNGFHKALEGLICVFFDYSLIKYYNKTL